MKHSYLKNLVITLVCTFACSTASTQDFHLSQYDAAALNFNPAMTGMFKGDYRVHGHYRTQWSSIVTRPYRTALLSFDMPLKNRKFAIGGQLANFNAGAGGYNVFSFMASGSYTITLDKNENHFLRTGLSIGFFQKSINMESLYFESQYVQEDGGYFNESLSNQENVGSQSFLQHDANVGLLYYYGKQGVTVNPFVGLTVFHVSRARETFYGTDNYIPIRYMGHAGANFKLGKKVSLLPKVIYMYQKNAAEIMGSLMGHFYLEKPDFYLLAGFTYRSKDAAIVEAGVKWNGFTVRASYDINASGLSPVSSGRGGTEVSLTYIFNKDNPIPVPSCPRL